MSNDFSTHLRSGDSASAPPVSPMSVLRNAIHEPGRTCRVCAAPLDGYEMCFRCHRRRRLDGLADVVAPLMYAVAGDASAQHLSGYKNAVQRRDRERHANVVAAVLSAGLRHEPCVVAAVGIPISAYTVIPSLTSRPGRHPLTALASSMCRVDEQMLTATFDPPCDRTIRLDKFTVESSEAVHGRHVALIDDVWTTGANAQSAALTLRRAGAAAVSVLVVGRWVDPSHPASARFIGQQRRPYDPLLCPVNARKCCLRAGRALTA